MATSEKGKEIKSLSDLLAYVAKKVAKRGQWLYRGQPQDKPLLPRIVRNKPHPEAVQIEKEIIRTFKIRARPYLDSTAMSELEWLALAQHEGLATRLLDWTDNPLVGLWFAVNGPPPTDGRPGVLWVFEVQSYIVTEDSDPYDGDTTGVFRPPHVTPSISAQGGWFTVHKYIKRREHFVPLERNSLYADRLHSLIIPANRFDALRCDLDVCCGINEAQLFPGLAGLARHLNRTRLGINS